MRWLISSGPTPFANSAVFFNGILILLPSERPKLNTNLAFLSAIGLNARIHIVRFTGRQYWTFTDQTNTFCTLL